MRVDCNVFEFAPRRLSEKIRIMSRNSNIRMLPELCRQNSRYPDMASRIERSAPYIYTAIFFCKTDQILLDLEKLRSMITQVQFAGDSGVVPEVSYQKPHHFRKSGENDPTSLSGIFTLALYGSNSYSISSDTKLRHRMWCDR